MAQLSKKSNENADVLAQIQKKGFAIEALKNELRELTGNIVNTKFAKPSILGKPVLQPHRNQSVVRQPTAFKSERPKISKPRYSLKYRYIVQSYKGRTQSLVAEKTDISENRASRNFDLMINIKTFDRSRSSLGLHGNDFKAGSKSCSLSKQDSYITTRVGITIPPSHSNAEDNSGNDAQDSEWTESDDDENPSFTLKDYKEEQDEEYVHTPEKDKSNNEEKLYEEEDDDVAKEVFTLETKIFEFNQTSQFAKVVSSILGIVDQYLASKIKEAVDVVVRLQSNKLKEETKAENQELFNQVDSTMKAIIKDQILIDKMETNKSINISDIQKNLYNALVEAYNSDKRKSSKDVNPSKGSKSKESKSSSSSKGTQSQPKSSQAEEPEFEAADTKIQQDKWNESGHIDDQPDNDGAPKHDWFQKPDKPPTPDHGWNKSKSVDFRALQKWISTIAKARQPPRTFDELIDTPIDFSAYVMNRLKIDNLTQEILVGPSFNLLKGSCKSFVELEYHFEECYKAVNDRLNWHNLEGCEYSFDLSKPLPLIEDRGRQVVPADYFINNDLEYLKGGSSSSKYATSTTRTKAAKYDNIEGIEDMVPTLWSPVKVAYNKHAVWGRWYNYGYLEIVVRRGDNVLYKFKEGDFPRLNLRDIDDMLLLLVQKKLSNLDVDDRLMRSDELYKFYDETLSSVRIVLNDIASNLEMDYLPKRHWSNLEMKRSCIMVKAIDKLLFERRLMRNLEKFIGGCDYGNDLRLLKRTI
ncbi:hypothetical protein Tco_0926415 [Tanacetum coccineum]|uniref:Uncharacterized protein n=1 Tax=Tanacetum coccineum TaxID=301880 RepID=A0ABQ5D9Q3_9ASTR